MIHYSSMFMLSVYYTETSSAALHAYDSLSYIIEENLITALIDCICCYEWSVLSHLTLKIILVIDHCSFNYWNADQLSLTLNQQRFSHASKFSQHWKSYMIIQSHQRSIRYMTVKFSRTKHSCKDWHS